MIFVWLQIPNVSKKYRTALIINGLVTGIATYHYFRIFNSWNDAFDVKINSDNTGYNVKLSGQPFNDAYRYVDWLLTVPLLLIELVLVMKLDEAETVKRCWVLGVASALMIANGYPGETSNEAGTRWMFWFLSMLPFTYIVYTLFFGLKESQDAQPEEVRDMVKYACYATVFSWCTYPVVYVFPMLTGSTQGKGGLDAQAMVAIQVGYTVSDIISKCGVGYLVYRIGLAKSSLDGTKFGGDEAAAEEGM